MLKLEVAIINGEQALALAYTSGQPDLIIPSLDTLTSLKMHVGAWQEYEQLATEALTYSISTGDRAMEANALCMLANAQMHRGCLQPGITQAHSALMICQEMSNIWGQINACYDLTSGLLDSGEYTEALDRALQAVTSTRTLNTYSARANMLLLRALIQLGGVYRAMQAGSAAHVIDLEALTLIASTSSSYTTIVASVLCADCILVGAWTEAHRYAQQAATIVDEHGRLYVETPHWRVTEALLHAGEAPQVQEYLQRLNTHRGDGQRDRVQYLWASAKLAQWEGQLEQARAHLEEAYVLTEEIGLADERWQIQVALGDLDHSRGEYKLADQAYIQAGNVVQTLAERIRDETLQMRFLTAPQVRHVFERAAR